MKWREPLFRPPAEAESLIFQVAYGCPHNTCRFCGMYKGVRYGLRDPAELSAEIREAGGLFPKTNRVFLADGDVMHLPMERLRAVLTELNASFPHLARVGTYANGSSILSKTPEELAELKRLKLHLLYVGFESGSQRVLDRFRKGERADDMVRAVRLAQSCGLKCSVMILIGLGGRALREEHVICTAAALNLMNPNQLSALRFIAVPGLPLPEGYVPVTEFEAAEELRGIIAGLNLERTVFRANHASNPFPLAGRFPHDRSRLLAELDAELRSGRLDTRGPGRMPLEL